MMSDSRSTHPEPGQPLFQVFLYPRPSPKYCIVALPFVHKPYLPPAKHCLTQAFPADDLDISEQASYIHSSRLSGAARIVPDHMPTMRHNS